MKAIFYDWGGLNAWLFGVVNGFHADWLDRFMLLGTQLADHDNFPLWLAAIVLASLFALRGSAHHSFKPWLAVIAVFSLGYVVDGWLVGTLKAWFAFPRPLLALPPDMVHVVGMPEHNLQHSLPSGHASFATLIAASLWPLLHRPGRIAAVLFVVWVGLSRMSLGAHFPADVVAGALSCLLVVWVVRKIVRFAMR